MEFLPSDVFPLILSFVKRPDWRTCRKHEADIISHFNRWTHRVLDDDSPDWDFPILIGRDELEAYSQWSMFGRWFLIQKTRDDPYWSYTSRYNIVPPRCSDHYMVWYTRSFIWLHTHTWRTLCSKWIH